MCNLCIPVDRYMISSCWCVNLVKYYASVKMIMEGYRNMTYKK